MQALAEGGWLQQVDFCQTDKKGRTPFQLAREQLASKPTDARAASIVLLLQREGRQWQQERRAQLHSLLDADCLIPDLTGICADYLVGDGDAFGLTAEEEASTVAAIAAAAAAEEAEEQM
jgi:S-adenosylmethionine:tRNA-ribosyltransferase-isomerase (queuine synthetase)